jgi:transposase-like protein
MAERARMTAAQLADKLMSDEHADVLAESVAWMARELMEADVSAQIGAEQALVAVVQEAYVNGVSTRKVDRLVEQMACTI